MSTVTLDLPPEVSPDEARLLFAMALFQDGKLSLGRAAEVSGYSKRAFMEFLGQRGIPVFNYGPEDLDEELRNLSGEAAADE